MWAIPLFYIINSMFPPSRHVGLAFFRWFSPLILHAGAWYIYSMGKVHISRTSLIWGSLSIMLCLALGIVDRTEKHRLRSVGLFVSGLFSFFWYVGLGDVKDTYPFNAVLALLPCLCASGIFFASGVISLRVALVFDVDDVEQMGNKLRKLVLMTSFFLALAILAEFVQGWFHTYFQDLLLFGLFVLVLFQTLPLFRIENSVIRVSRSWLTLSGGSACVVFVMILSDFIAKL